MVRQTDQRAPHPDSLHLMVRAITDVWHGEAVGAERIVSEEARRTRRWRTTLRMCALSFRNDAIITAQGSRSVYGLAFLAAFLTVTGQRKLFIVEFLPGKRGGVKGRVAAILYRLFLGRASLGIQVMTQWEKDDYIARYRLPAARVHLIPLFFCDDRVDGAPLPPREPCSELRIMASGKNSCDWDTLLEAATGQRWRLTIVATEEEGDRIRERALAAGIELRTNLPRNEHDALLHDSDLFVLALKQGSSSAGQVRIMSAATYGLPVVASEVRGIRGYEALACATVPPGDHLALRRTIQSFVESPRRLHERARAVQSIAASRPRSVYVEELALMFEQR